MSPTRPEHVLDGLSGRIEAVLDGGTCGVGVESTILAPGEPPLLLRPGGLPAEALEECLGRPLVAGGSADRPSAPGQLASHYAPEAPVRLGATEARPGESWIGFGKLGGPQNLSPSGDLVEAAANLFHFLREADREGRPIAVAPVPERGLGRAINDRLRRAAAPGPDHRSDRLPAAVPHEPIHRQAGDTRRSRRRPGAACRCPAVHQRLASARRGRAQPAGRAARLAQRSWAWQPTRWSFTMPVACMKA